MNVHLTGKTAVITEGAQGIGRDEITGGQNCIQDIRKPWGLA